MKREKKRAQEPHRPSVSLTLSALSPLGTRGPRTGLSTSSWQRACSTGSLRMACDPNIGTLPKERRARRGQARRAALHFTNVRGGGGTVLGNVPPPRAASAGAGPTPLIRRARRRHAAPQHTRGRARHRGQPESIILGEGEVKARVLGTHGAVTWGQ